MSEINFFLCRDGSDTELILCGTFHHRDKPIDETKIIQYKPRVIEIYLNNRGIFEAHYWKEKIAEAKNINFLEEKVKRHMDRFMDFMVKSGIEERGEA